jgi:hypothetical protein
MKLYYGFKDNARNDISDVLQLNVKPKWYKNLSVFVGGFNSAYKSVKEYGFHFGTSDDPLPKTAKTCPSMIHLFGSSSGVIKAPCDIIIRTKDENYDWVSSSKAMRIASHPDQQLPQLSKKYNIFKFDSNIGIQVSKNCQMTFLDNILHQETEFRPCPGVIDLHKNGKVLPLNVIAFFPKSEDLHVYEIKKGTVLSTISFSEKIEQITEKDMLQDFENFESGRSKFIGSWKDQ